jgi:hypothetical protein
MKKTIEELEREAAACGKTVQEMHNERSKELITEFRRISSMSVEEFEKDAGRNDAEKPDLRALDRRQCPNLD